MYLIANQGVRFAMDYFYVTHFVHHAQLLCINIRMI